MKRKEKMMIDTAKIGLLRYLSGALLLFLILAVGSCTTEQASQPTAEQASGMSSAPTVFPEAAYEEALELTAPDSVTVYGMLVRPASEAPVPLILAFHQGGASGLAEYAPVIPRLLREGFAVLTIDQRRGGSRFEGVNRTAAPFPDQNASYCDVYADLETTLDYALRLPDISEIIAWGSSYSATLAAKLAADYPGAVAKVVAFSPASGDVMAGCRAVPIAERIEIPALFLRPESEMANDWVSQDMDAFVRLGHLAFVASPGTHGASMLVAERSGGDTEQTWQVVLEFMRTPDSNEM